MEELKWLWNKFTNSLYRLLMRLYTAVSFILIALNLAFIIYYEFVEFNPLKVFVGGFSLCVMLHLNKSL